MREGWPLPPCTNAIRWLRECCQCPTRPCREPAWIGVGSKSLGCKSRTRPFRGEPPLQATWEAQEGSRTLVLLCQQPTKLRNSLSPTPRQGTTACKAHRRPQIGEATDLNFLAGQRHQLQGMKPDSAQVYMRESITQGYMYITLAKGQASLQNCTHMGTADVRCPACKRFRNHVGRSHTFY